MYCEGMARALVALVICLSAAIASCAAEQAKEIPVDLSGRADNWAFTGRVKKASFEDGMLHLPTLNRRTTTFVARSSA